MAGHQAGGFDHTGETGEGPANGVNRSGVEIDRDAGVHGGDFIAADGKSVAPEAGVFEDEVDNDGTNHEQPQDKRNAEQATLSDKGEGGRDAVDRQAIGQNQGGAAIDAEGPERHYERRDAEAGDEQAVEEAAAGTDNDTDENTHRDRVSGFQRHCAYQTRQAEDGANGKVNAAGDDDDGHAEGHGVEHGRLPGYAGKIVSRQEVGRGDGQADEQRDEAEERQEFLEEARIDFHAALFPAVLSGTASFMICS